MTERSPKRGGIASADEQTPTRSHPSSHKRTSTPTQAASQSRQSKPVPATAGPTILTVGKNRILCGALHNDTSVLVLFYPDRKIAGALGMAIYRREVQSNGTLAARQPLLSRLPFKGQENPTWDAKPTDVWPIAKFSWFDFEAEWDKTYVYEIVPMGGQPGNLVPMNELMVRTNAVSLTTACGKYFEAAFTRGILASQKLARVFPHKPDGSLDEEEFIRQLKTPGSAIRKAQGGRVVEFMLSLIRKAEKEGGHVYDARYEFNDPEMVAEYERLSRYISIILGNAGKNDETNKETRARFKAARMDVIDRIYKEDSQSIPHDKLGIYQNAKGQCTEVMGMSTNATWSAPHTQTNNCTKIKYPPFAQRVKSEYWDPLKADTLLGGAMQSAAFRAANAKGPIEEVLPDGTRIICFRSPNMPEREKPKVDPATPPDMAFLEELMEGTESMLLFLLFYPGWPSVMNKIMSLNKRKKNLFLRGAVSSPQAMPGGSFKLYRRKGEPPQIVAASALDKSIGVFTHPELLKLSTAHAIIHDKCLVGDMHNPNKCWVCFGSHQLGFKASYCNDELMFIVIGPSAQLLVIAYGVHILATYQTYSFRYIENKNESGFTGYLTPDDSWQDRRFELEGLKFEGDVWRNSGLLKEQWPTPDA